jgi:hypothetical protein
MANVPAHLVNGARVDRFPSDLPVQGGPLPSR